MKVRTLTLGLPGLPDESALGVATETLHRVRDAVTQSGFEVQTLRLALGPFETHLGQLPPASRLQAAIDFDGLAGEQGFDFVALGPVRDLVDIENLGPLLAATSRLCANAPITRAGEIDAEAIAAAARVVLHLAHKTEGGLGNFCFAASSLVQAGVPFFPVASHDGVAPSLGVGLENSDLFVEGCRRAGSVDNLAESLRGVMMDQLQPLEATVVTALGDVGWSGIDTSIASSLEPVDSIARGYEALGLRFGGVGTLAVAAATTGVLKSLDVTRTGYCGLMLPVLEDAGLMSLADESAYGLQALLAASAVCGVGIDTVPLPGDVSESVLGALIRDVAALSLKWSKPLACRVLPAPGYGQGDRTNWNFPHMGNCRVFDL